MTIWQDIQESDYRQLCPGCNGNRKYVGLNKIENPCEECKGFGWVDERWCWVDKWTLEPGQELLSLRKVPTPSILQTAAHACGWSGRGSDAFRYDRTLALLDRLQDLTRNFPVSDLVSASPPLEGHDEHCGVLTVTDSNYVLFDNDSSSYADNPKIYTGAIIADLNPDATEWEKIKEAAATLANIWTPPGPLPNHADCQFLEGRSWIGSKIRIG